MGDLVEIPYQSGFSLLASGPSWVVDSWDGEVWIRCRCGLLLDAARSTRVAPDGTLGRLVGHLLDARGYVACGWSSRVRLVDWIDGDVETDGAIRAPLARERAESVWRVADQGIH